MTTVNDEMQDLLRARTIANADERNELLARVLGKLVANHLRRPSDVSEGRPDEVSRVLIIIRHLATKQAGAFHWGEPSAVGPTILGLIEQLPCTNEERQCAVLGALEDVLQLLRMGSARALACVGNEAVALLRALPSSSAATGTHGTHGSMRGFEGFAKLCAPPT